MPIAYRERAQWGRRRRERGSFLRINPLLPLVVCCAERGSTTGKAPTHPPPQRFPSMEVSCHVFCRHC
ncbi:hypothetical protein Taro_039930 [Colocasia esculenta]|uniref:Uncharacterized protein n=1 Tax=Colocasia esculenta TaxID=4460 RepID=A0A843WRK1_COLES|nr:hypothetical protein [Colocasia esculenta]